MPASDITTAQSTKPAPRHTGHYLLGNGYRLYSAELMRFNSPDRWSPFGRGGLNPHAWCLGDPVNRRDPGGHFSLPSVLPMLGDILQVLAPVSGGQAREEGGGSGALTVALVIGGAVLGSALVGGLFSQAKEFVDLSRKALVRRYSFDGTSSGSAARNLVEGEVAGIENPSSFTTALRTTNLSLRSHGDTSLSMEHAQKYVGVAKAVERGEISNTTAHVVAAAEWRSVAGPGGQVGQVFNLLGALGSGAGVDARLRKTGKSIHK